MKTVLVVEDNADLRMMFRTALALDGFRVLEADDGLMALRLLDASPPDIVILDLGLPIISGHVVREEIAAQADLRNIPVVIVTGGPAGNPQGVACVLRKPVLPDELIRTVRRCLTAGAGQRS